jgi:tryptophan synthase alpha chain
MASGGSVSGVERIAAAFASARADGRRAALMPYLMGGFPDLETSRRIGLAYADAGADLVELGVPFSDPLADGPVIHAAGTAALAAGATVEAVLDVALSLSQRIPVVLMSYANPIFVRGPERFAGALLEAGVSGLIVPDLPLEEAGELARVCDEREIALIQLVAPTTPEQRMAAIAATARGFLYVVAVTGITGERAGLDPRLGELLARAGAHARVPVAVGFGIGEPAQAAEAAAAGAEGVIVASRLVRAAGEGPDPVAAVAALVSSFSEALTSDRRVPPGGENH